MIALRIAYDGSVLQGSQRQPHGQTVENKMLYALSKVGWNPISDRSPIRLVSRTDKGVSAQENVAFISGEASFLQKYNRLGRMQKQLDSIWITGIADAGYAPPYYKEYWYFLPPNIMPGPVLTAVCSLFSGTHDFTSFCKTNVLKSPVRTIGASHLTVGNATVLSLTGDGFLWQMCRRIAAACIAVCNGDMHLDVVGKMLDSPSGKRMWAAPGDQLVLHSVSSPILFSDVLDGIGAMRKYYAEKYSFWAPLVAHYATNL